MAVVSSTMSASGVGLPVRVTSNVATVSAETVRPSNSVSDDLSQQSHQF